MDTSSTSSGSRAPQGNRNTFPWPNDKGLRIVWVAVAGFYMGVALPGLAQGGAAETEGATIGTLESGSSAGSGSAASGSPTILERIETLRSEHDSLTREIAAETGEAQRAEKLERAAELKLQLERLEGELRAMNPSQLPAGVMGSAPGVATIKPLHELGEPDPGLSLSKPMDSSRPAFSLDTPMTEPDHSPKLLDMRVPPSVDIADPPVLESVTRPLDKNARPTVPLEGGPSLEEETLSSADAPGPRPAEPVSRTSGSNPSAGSPPAAVNSGNVPQVEP